MPSASCRAGAVLRLLIAWAAALALFPVAVGAAPPPAWTFSAPVTLNPVAGSQTAVADSRTPLTAVGDGGDAVVVWTHDLGLAGSVVEAASRSRRGPWSGVQTLSAPEGAATNPQVAVSQTGEAVAVWTRRTSAGVVVETARRALRGGLRRRGGWSRPVAISAAAPLAFVSDMAVARNGVSLVAWEQRIDEGVVVEAAWRRPDGRWTAPQRLSAPGSRFPQVAITRAGERLVVWERDTVADGSSTVIEVATRQPGGGWSSPQALSAPDGESRAAQIVVAMDGIATVAWNRFVGPSASVQAVTRLEGGAWSAPQNVSGTGGNAADLSLAANGRGDVVLAFLRRVGLATVVEVATRPVRQAWSAPIALSAPDGNAFPPHAGIDRRGNAAVAWQRSAPVAPAVVEVASRVHGAEWSLRQMLTRNSFVERFSSGVDLAVGGRGDAVVTWPVQVPIANTVVQAASARVRLRGWR